jgi:hypothetical protein
MTQLYFEGRRFSFNCAKMAQQSDQNARRSVCEGKEQIPIKETISLRQKHVGKSCKLFYRQDPIKFVKAKGNLRIF